MSHLGKVYVVTGGNSGIGYGTAKLLADEGAKVYITGRNSQAVTKAASDLGRNVIGLHADSASIADSVHLAEIIAGNGDKLDGVFINAGIAKFVPFELVDEAHFDELININFKGAYFTIQKLLPVLKDGSSIVLNSSNAANIGFAASSVYAASKAALSSLTKTLSRDLLPRKIRVNGVNPVPIVTPALSKTGLDEETLKGLTAQIASQVPIGRRGDVEEIAGYVAFLLSDKSTFILGTSLTIDGGMTQI